MLELFVYITRLASNEIFSTSNKIHREVGRAKDLSVHRYVRRLPITQSTYFKVTSLRLPGQTAEKYGKTSVTVGDVPKEIRTRHLPNPCMRIYCWSQFPRSVMYILYLYAKKFALIWGSHTGVVKESSLMGNYLGAGIAQSIYRIAMGSGGSPFKMGWCDFLQHFWLSLVPLQWVPGLFPVFK